MSEAQSDADAPHEGPIKTPRQLVAAVLAAFIVPVLVILLLASYVSSDTRPGAGSNLLDSAAVAERIRPVGWAQIRDASAATTPKTGEQVFAAQCTACHTTGVAGAPKLGDSATWAPRIATGYAALVTSALKGKNAMTAQGGGGFSDLEIGRAVAYMANKAGARFDEPAAAPTAASAPTVAAAEGASAPAR